MSNEFLTIESSVLATVNGGEDWGPAIGRGVGQGGAVLAGAGVAVLTKNPVAGAATAATLMPIMGEAGARAGQWVQDRVAPKPAQQ